MFGCFSEVLPVYLILFSFTERKELKDVKALDKMEEHPEGAYTDILPFSLFFLQYSPPFFVSPFHSVPLFLS